MSDAVYIPRTHESLLAETLADTPVVLIHGPRQCGKTTLARRQDRPYLTLDEAAILVGAREDPVGFLADLPDGVTIDEIQKAPELLPEIKRIVDLDRRPGRFLITGSANVMMLPRLSESLAGRMGIVRLHPLSNAEIERRGDRFLDVLFAADFRVGRSARLGRTLIERIIRGGYPEMLERDTPHRREAWARDYLEEIVSRDVLDVSQIRKLDILPRLLTIAAYRTAGLLNVSSLANALTIGRQTVDEYIVLLSRLFLLDVLPAWHGNRAKRLVKAPKLHFGDTGLAAALADVDTEEITGDRDLLGHYLETYVLQELRRQASARPGRYAFHHYRDKDKVEVDIVIERGARQVAGVEVKAGATVRPTDFKGLRRLQRVAGEAFVCGIVLYDGETCVPMGEGLYAVPISML